MVDYLKEKVKAKLERTQRNQGRHAHKPYDSSEVDEFAIYCPGTDEVYRISVTDAPKTEVYLRVEEAKKADSSIRWASEYRL